jgi:ATP-dependent helicase/nuclease subunit B
MSTASPAVLGKSALFERLAAKPAVTVVTPNLRLAQELGQLYDSFQLGRGLAVWDAPDILPLETFFVRAYEDACCSGHVAQMPVLLTALQETALWQQAIEASAWSEALLALTQAAASAREAWKKAHEWQIEGALASWPGSEDTRAFVEWSQAYARRTRDEGYVDAARLPGAVAQWLAQGAARKPPLLVAYAFDIVTPQLSAFFSACRSLGIEVVAAKPERVEARPARIACKSAGEEIERAAQWARARLEAGAARIGIVVADLALRRSEVQRVFAGVMQPGYNLPGTAKKPLPFNLSLGLPLAGHPLVGTALAILEIAGATSKREADFALASALVRSPFLAGADAEMASRARLDARLREISPATLTLPGFLAAVAMSGVACPMLSFRLDALFEYARRNLAGSKSPHEWVRHFSALLDAAGFASGRMLDSEEFQTRAKFHEILAELAGLERIVPRLGYAAALARLRSLCAGTLFQPARFGKGSEAPVQVLGILESAGLEFDHLWVSGLTDEAWPLDSRPNPFLPPSLQRKAGVPEASAETALELDRRITHGWLGAAPEVVVSHALRENDRDLAPSPLVAALPLVEWVALGVAAVTSHRDLLFAARSLETAADGWAPPLVASAPRGGTRILADQSACPFRAFARHRLAAKSLDTPSPGLDAAARGQLLHALFAGLWGELKSQAGLESAIADGSLGAIVATAAGLAVAKVREDRPGGIDKQFAALECARLAKLARDWLEVERVRTPFEVVAREEKRTLGIGGLSLSGRIDRMDRLEAGGHAIIDYKTGRASPREWMDARPDDPQMPLYAISAPEQVSAVTFAKIRTGEMKFMGFSRDAAVIPKVKAAENWDGLFAGWRTALEELAHDFAHGDARVEPKRLPATCAYCDLQPLCRVYERYGALAGEGEPAGGDGAEEEGP